MSVLIKGVEMPKICYDCDFAYQDQDSEHNVYWTCAAVHKSACMHERREDCPLVPIPPHGDLIDRKTAYNSLLDGMVMTGYQSMALDCISDFYVPTIIPAEEGET